MPVAKKKAPAKAQPVSLATLKKQLIEHTDAFCKEHLNKEYRDMCRVMAKGLCVEGSPVRTADPHTWAAAIVAAVGYVNFLDDPEFKPFIAQKDLARKLGISQATMRKYRMELIEGFELIPFDPDFTLPSMIPMNPLIALASSPSLLQDCCAAGSCCEDGACSMEACDREDCCQLEGKSGPKKKARKK